MTNETDVEKKADEDRGNLSLVPDNDIAKHARPACVTCNGSGKVSVRWPDAAKFRMLVCRCALKRFVVANRESLSVDKGGRLYYRKSLKVVISKNSETVESGETGASNSLRSRGESERLVVMRERIVALDEKMVEIDEQYDRRLVPLSADFNVAEKIYCEEKSKSRELSLYLSRLNSQIDNVSHDIELLEESLRKDRARREKLLQMRAEISERQSREEARLEPFGRSLIVALDAIHDLNKKRHQAQTPYRQRRESLVKRLAHKAAGLGLSQDGQPATGDEVSEADCNRSCDDPGRSDVKETS